MGSDRQGCPLLGCGWVRRGPGRDSLAGCSRDQYGVHNFPSCLHLGEARGARGVIGSKLGAGFAHILRRDMADDFARFTSCPSLTGRSVTVAMNSAATTAGSPM